MKIGSAIKDYREGLGMNQSDLASRSGINQGYLSSIESGSREPSLNMIGRISHSLGLTRRELLDLGIKYNNSKF